MQATIHFSVNIKGDSFEDLQKKISALTSLLKEQGISYTVNSEGAA